MSPRAESSAALLSLVAGRATTTVLPSTRDLDELRARAQVDGGATQTLLSLAHQSTLATRVAAAAAEDVCVVVMPDGSSFSRADAERHLSAKEDERVYQPLRTPLLRARRAALDPVALRASFDDAIVAMTGAAPPVPTKTTEALAALLAATAPLMAPALEALATLARGDVSDASTLVRALDLPLRDRAADEAATDVVRLTRPSLSGDSSPLVRRAGPRVLAGHVVIGDAHADGARLFVAPARRQRARRAMTRGAGRALAHCAGLGEVGAGLALALDAPPVSRALDVSARDAERTWRETIVATLIELRITAAVAHAMATVDVDPEAPARDALMSRRDAARGAARAAIGFDVGAELVDDVLMPPWPDGRADFDARNAAARAAHDVASSFAAYVALREVRDDAGLLRPSGLMAIREAQVPVPDVAAAVATLFREVA